jgi:nitrogen fixation protein FixH
MEYLYLSVWSDSVYQRPYIAGVRFNRDVTGWSSAEIIDCYRIVPVMRT